MEKKKVIKKIQLTVGGLKGLVLSGIQESVKENKLAINGFSDTIRHPIHTTLEDKIGELRYNVLDICGLIRENTDKNLKKSLVHECDIVSIEFNQGETPWFKIKATSRLFDEKFQTIITPKVDAEDSYEFFDTVMKIIEAILEEVDHYVNKTKVLSDDELMESLLRHGKGKNIDRAALEGMDFEEKSKWLHEELNKIGYITTSIHVSELEEGEGEQIDLEDKPESNEIDFRQDENPMIEEGQGEGIEESLKISEPVMLKK